MSAPSSARSKIIPKGLGEHRCTAMTLDRVILFFSRHWLMWLNLAVGLWVVLPWMAPVLMHVGAIGPAHLIYKIYSLQCHQLPQRSYFLFGTQVMIPLDKLLTAWPEGDLLKLGAFIGTPELGWKAAWSDRMVSLYTPLFLGGLLFALARRWWKRPPFHLWALLLVPLALDGITHLISDVSGLGFRDTNAWLGTFTGHIWPTTFYAGDMIGSFNWWMRLLTGLLAGFATACLLYPLLQLGFSEMENGLGGKLALCSTASQEPSDKTGAKPREGSSKSKSRGGSIKPLPMASICCSPPLKVPPS